MTIEILTCFWGDLHTSLLVSSLIPSLHARGNISAMRSAGHEIKHVICCLKSDAEKFVIEGSEICSNHFTGDPSYDRAHVLHMFYRDAIARGNLVIIAPCDLIFGCGLWDAIKDLKPGEYLVSAHARIELESGLPHLGDLFARFSNKALVNFAMSEHPHAVVKRGIGTDNAYWRTIDRGDHWETYFTDPVPLAFWGTPDMLEAWCGERHYGNLEVVDHELVNWCFQRNRLKWIDDSRKFFWAEWTSKNTYAEKINTVAGQDHPANLPSMRHFSKTPVRWYK